METAVACGSRTGKRRRNRVRFHLPLDVSAYGVEVRGRPSVVGHRVAGIGRKKKHGGEGSEEKPTYQRSRTLKEGDATVRRDAV